METTEAKPNSAEPSVLPAADSIVISPAPPASNKKTLLIAAALAVIVFIILLLGALILMSNRAGSPDSQDVQDNSTQTSKTKKQSSLFSPKVQFDSYVLEKETSLPTAQIASKYLLKTGFSQADAASVGTIFGLSTIAAQQNGYAVSNTTDKANYGMMAFDKRTGSFQIQLFGQQKPPGIQAQSTQQKAFSALSAIGVADPSVECLITYQLKEFPDVTYVECHRNWQKLNLPLVDLAGVMNMRTDDLISDATPGAVYSLTPLNASVVNVSNGGNGRARPNDFNTATVGVRTDGTIASIDSNLRWINESQQLTQQDLISGDQALSLASQGKAQMSFSMPSASSSVNWTKVYPGNSSSATKASIDEVLLVYLEKPGGEVQAAYEPHYLIRGTSFLKSGNAVKYVQAIAAQRSKYTEKDLTSASQPVVVADGNADPLKLDALVPVFQEPPPPTPGVDSPPTISSLCSAQDIANNPNQGGWAEPGGQYPESLEIPGYGTVRIRLHNAPNAFYVVGLNNGQAVDMGAVRGALSKHGITIYPSGSGCIITSISPAIFLYPKTNLNVAVTLGSPVVFTNPVASNSAWSRVIAKPDGSLYVNNTEVDYLYYEYDLSKVRFENNKIGYIVERKNARQVIKRVAAELNLNTNETTRLEDDSAQALAHVKSSYVKISIAGISEVNSKLPLTILPQPDTIHRINLIFSTADANDNVVKPILKPLIRSGFTVVEVGVSIAK